MPTYTFIDKKTETVFDIVMKMSELDEYKKQNPEYSQIIGSPNIISGFNTTKKVPEGFKEVLAKVAENHKTSELADRISKKSIKEVKTEQIVDKHWKRSQE